MRAGVKSPCMSRCCYSQVDAAGAVVGRPALDGSNGMQLFMGSGLLKQRQHVESIYKESLHKHEPFLAGPPWAFDPIAGTSDAPFDEVNSAG